MDGNAFRSGQAEAINPRQWVWFCIEDLVIHYKDLARHAKPAKGQFVLGNNLPLKIFQAVPIWYSSRSTSRMEVEDRAVTSSARTSRGGNTLSRSSLGSRTMRGRRRRRKRRGSVPYLLCRVLDLRRNCLCSQEFHRKDIEWKCIYSRFLDIEMAQSGGISPDQLQEDRRKCQTCQPLMKI